MKVIKENIVALLRFIRLLFRTFVLLPQKRDWKQEDYPTKTAEAMDKYKALIGPSEPLTPTETKFCPKCHVEIAQLRRTKRGTEIIQHGKVLVTVGGNIIIAKHGQEGRGFPIKCPNGHVIRID